MIYKERMKELRTMELITQKDMASFINIGRSAYSQYEAEYIVIPLEHLINFCNYFNVSLDYIFGFTNILQYDLEIKDVNSIEAGKRLKEWRKNNKLTQELIANIVNTNRSVIANYERGRNLISLPFLHAICSKYKISADYLLGRIDEALEIKIKDKKKKF